MRLDDKVLKCVDCSAEFAFTADEQLYFQSKQFTHEPKHCRRCKAKFAKGASKKYQEIRTTCAKCGTETTVPFVPKQGRPVLCRACFQMKA